MPEHLSEHQPRIVCTTLTSTQQPYSKQPASTLFSPQIDQSLSRVSPGFYSRHDIMSLTLLPVTRSHKFNDKDHAGLADGTVLPQDTLPKYFAKSGFADADPKKTKKNGGGRANW